MLAVIRSLKTVFGFYLPVLKLPRHAKRGMAALGVGMFVLSLSANSAWAWEADVHYGLTKWLAIQAGFAKQRAELIAKGNQSVDDSWVTGPVHSTIVSSCITRDPSGSMIVHDHHFSSEGLPPATPDRRVVAVGKTWPGGVVGGPPPLDGSESRDIALGIYLHALQDSWSHQGEPDPPYFCHSDMGWGHAMARGGWSCHLADLTYRWQEDLSSMAEATFNVLSGARNNESRKEWKDLNLLPRLEKFAASQTKWDKDKWFESEGFSDRTFLQQISLPDCNPSQPPCRPYPSNTLLDLWRDLNATRKLDVTAIPQEIVLLFARFFSAVATQSISDVRKEIIDESLAELALSRALHVDGSCPQLYETLVPFMLGDQFSDGRGGHMPLLVCELATRVDQKTRKGISCADAVKEAKKAVAEAVPRGPGLRGQAKAIEPALPYTYTVERDPKLNRYFAVGRFIHLPRDVIVVGAEKVKDRPMVTSFIWLPNE